MKEIKIERPHIKLYKINNNVVLDIDTWELKDIIEDYFREKCNIDYEYFEELNPELAITNYESYRLFFSQDYTLNQIAKFLKKFSDEELINIVEFQRSYANRLFYCECCGYNTLNEKPNGTYQICKTCFWEDDPFQRQQPDDNEGANNVSLNQAKKNFEEFGACEKRFIKDVQKVHKSDIRNPKYRID